MKAKEGKLFIKWLNVLVVMDNRLTVSDLPKLTELFKKGNI